MKITVIGKKGCMKCAKMDAILKDRGNETELVYVDGPGAFKAGNIDVNVDENTHFPLYVANNALYNDYKSLMEILNG